MGDPVLLFGCQASTIQQGLSELVDHSLCILRQASSAKHDVVLPDDL